MKMSKKTWLNNCIWLLSCLVAFGGLAGCMADADNPGESAIESELPYAKYEIKGQVENIRKEKLSNIQVVVKQLRMTSYNEWLNETDTLYTDRRGEFHYIDEHALAGTKCRVICNDIGKNGTNVVYKTDSINVEMDDATNGEDWYRGEVYREVTIILNEQPAASED